MTECSADNHLFGGEDFRWQQTAPIYAYRAVPRETHGIIIVLELAGYVSPSAARVPSSASHGPDLGSLTRLRDGPNPPPAEASHLVLQGTDPPGPCPAAWGLPRGIVQGLPQALVLPLALVPLQSLPLAVALQQDLVLALVLQQDLAVALLLLQGLS